MIPCAPTHLEKEKLSHDLWLKTLRNSKVRAAKDHGKKFQSRLAASFSGITITTKEFQRTEQFTDMTTLTKNKIAW